MIHHTTIIALTLLLTTSLPGATSTQPATQPVERKEGAPSCPSDTTNAMVTGTGLFVRALPSMTGVVCDKVDKPLRITVVGWDGKYWKILPTAGCRCFIARVFVRPDNKGESGTVLTPGVVIRVGCGRKPGLVVGRANRGDTVRIIEEKGDYYKILPPKGIYFYVSTKSVKGDRLIKKPPGPAGLIPKGSATPEEVVARVVKAISNGDQNLFVSCFDPPTRTSLVVEKLFQHSRAIQNLRNRAIEVFGKERGTEVPDGITTMLGIDLGWFGQAKIERKGDVAKAVWRKVGPDKLSETKKARLALRDGRWYLAAEKSPSRIKSLQVATIITNATQTLEEARERLSDKAITPEKINKSINKKTWEAIKKGDFAPP